MPDRCKQCGSEKMMPDVPLLDHYGDLGGSADTATVEVYGNPQAWMFKKTAVGKVSLRICGGCGHAELYVNNFQELYEKYEQSQMR